MDYNGFYIGIVVENNDPKYGGRVKVYVPEHSPNLDKLNKYIKEGKEIKFNAIDKQISPELVEILDDLKQSLPWAEYAGPIFGGSSDGRFRCTKKTTSTNDDVSFGQNNAQNGFRPLNKYMGSDVPMDDFVTRDGRTIAMPNKNYADYEPSNYSGMVRGIFSIPNVGAQVYVFYLNGDPMYPVYFAAAYNPDSIRKIYCGGQNSDSLTNLDKFWDYPAEFENENKETEDSKIFRSKTVLNSNKHTIEFIDTDGFEALCLQHYGGGFMQFHNYGTIEFTPGHDQKLIKGDKFLTVGDDHGVSIGGNESYRIRGNSHVQIGDYSANSENVQKVKKALEELGDIKRLFVVRRTNNKMPPKDTSSLQTREPASDAGPGNGFTLCPTCGGLAYDPYNVNGLNAGGTYFNDQTEEGKIIQQQFFEKHITLYDVDGNEENISADGFITTKNTKIEEDIEYGWSRIPKAVTYCYNEFEIPPPYFSEGYLSGDDSIKKDEDVQTSSVMDVVSGDEKEKVPHNPHQSTGQVGVFGGIHCPTCNNKLWEESKQTSAWAEDSMASGYSPSTENGSWMDETMTKKPYGQQVVRKFAEVSQTLAKMGDGGDKIETITMSKVENIGSVFNDIPSYRVDPIGKLRLDGLFVTQQSTVPYYLPTPHVEPIDVPNIPGGDYNLTIGNKWNVSVGSNGISIKTTGSMQLGGGVTSIATQEMNLSAKHDMVIDGGERLMIRARKVTVNPVEHNALSIDGQLHVLRNMIVRGGTLIDGELAVQHVTAPGELALTGPEIWVGGVDERCCVPALLTLAGAEIGYLDSYAGTYFDEFEKWQKQQELKARRTGHGWGNGGGSGVGGRSVSALEEEKKDGEDDDQTGGVGDEEETPFAALNRIIESVNALIEYLSSDMEVEICMPIHKHTFLQIPTSFKDCPNGVRAELLKENRNINSRQIVVSAKRRHHVGMLMEDKASGEVYEQNKELFDELVWNAIVGNKSAKAAHLEDDLGLKGITKGSNNSSTPSPTNYALLAATMAEGDKGVLFFYTVINYYKNEMVCPGKDKELGQKLPNAPTCRLTFEMSQVDDEDPTEENKEADVASRGYVKGTAKATLVGAPYNSAVQKNKENNEAQLKAWVGAWGVGSESCVVE